MDLSFAEATIGCYTGRISRLAEYLVLKLMPLYDFTSRGVRGTCWAISQAYRSLPSFARPGLVAQLLWGFWILNLSIALFYHFTYFWKQRMNFLIYRMFCYHSGRSAILHEAVDKQSSNKLHVVHVPEEADTEWPSLDHWSLVGHTATNTPATTMVAQESLSTIAPDYYKSTLHDSEPAVKPFTPDKPLVSSANLPKTSYDFGLPDFLNWPDFDWARDPYSVAHSAILCASAAVGSNIDDTKSHLKLASNAVKDKAAAVASKVASEASFGSSYALHKASSAHSAASMDFADAKSYLQLALRASSLASKASEKAAGAYTGASSVLVEVKPRWEVISDGAKGKAYFTASRATQKATGAYLVASSELVDARSNLQLASRTSLITSKACTGATLVCSDANTEVVAAKSLLASYVSLASNTAVPGFTAMAPTTTNTKTNMFPITSSARTAVESEAPAVDDGLAGAQSRIASYYSAQSNKAVAALSFAHTNLAKAVFYPVLRPASAASKASEVAAAAYSTKSSQLFNIMSIQAYMRQPAAASQSAEAALLVIDKLAAQSPSDAITPRSLAANVFSRLRRHIFLIPSDPVETAISILPSFASSFTSQVGGMATAALLHETSTMLPSKRGETTLHSSSRSYLSILPSWWFATHVFVCNLWGLGENTMIHAYNAVSRQLFWIIQKLFAPKGGWSEVLLNIMTWPIIFIARYVFWQFRIITAIISRIAISALHTIGWLLYVVTWPIFLIFNLAYSITSFFFGCSVKVLGIPIHWLSRLYSELMAHHLSTVLFALFVLTIALLCAIHLLMVLLWYSGHVQLMRDVRQELEATNGGHVAGLGKFIAGYWDSWDGEERGGMRDQEEIRQ